MLEEGGLDAGLLVCTGPGSPLNISSSFEKVISEATLRFCLDLEPRRMKFAILLAGELILLENLVEKGSLFGGAIGFNGELLPDDGVEGLIKLLPLSELANFVKGLFA